jgi:hypothetical protein
MLVTGQKMTKRCTASNRMNTVTAAVEEAGTSRTPSMVAQSTPWELATSAFLSPNRQPLAITHGSGLRPAKNKVRLLRLHLDTSILPSSDHLPSKHHSTSQPQAATPSKTTEINEALTRKLGISRGNPSLDHIRVSTDLVTKAFATSSTHPTNPSLAEATVTGHTTKSLRLKF